MRISKKKLLSNVGILVCVLIVNILVIGWANFDIKETFQLQYTIQSKTPDHYQVFYGKSSDWKEEQSEEQFYSTVGEAYTVQFSVPTNSQMIRIDFGSHTGEIALQEVLIKYLGQSVDITDSLVEKSNVTHDIDTIKRIGDTVVINRLGEDAYIEVDLNNIIPNVWFEADYYIKILFKLCTGLMLNIVIFIFIKKKNSIWSLAKEINVNKQLIWNLAKNDFKTKYAGSYLGITWAFVQPVVTVLVYWFVFQVGFRSAPIDDFPFVLWLVAGIVPWFFFAEAIMNATHSMIEYSYLVKKIVFKISILPVVKILSAFFVHVFFALFTVCLFALYGYIPTLYTSQIIYYTICVFVLVLGLSYATSAIIIFFKDLGQLIGILLQVGVWMTPIMWSYQIIPVKYQWIFKLNPMYYIVEGYRDSLINNVWFWDRFNQTIYFWIVVIALFGIGTLIFKRLKVHFADVL